MKVAVTQAKQAAGSSYSRSVSGIELLMEELVEVTVLIEGLMPYGG